MKKLFKSEKQEHLKISENHGKINNEDSKGLRRLYKGRIYVPRSQNNLYGSKHPKQRQKEEKGPSAHSIRLEHDPCA